MILKFKVKNQKIISYDSKPYIVSDSKNYIKLCFEFETEDWKDVDKYVYFKESNINEFIGDGCLCKINVPYEAMKNKFLMFTVYGKKDMYRITTEKIIIPLVKSGYTDNVIIGDGE